MISTHFGAGNANFHIFASKFGWKLGKKRELSEADFGVTALCLFVIPRGFWDLLGCHAAGRKVLCNDTLGDKSLREGKTATDKRSGMVRLAGWSIRGM
jgi:hypothetical protein